MSQVARSESSIPSLIDNGSIFQVTAKSCYDSDLKIALQFSIKVAEGTKKSAEEKLKQWTDLKNKKTQKNEDLSSEEEKGFKYASDNFIRLNGDFENLKTNQKLFEKLIVTSLGINHLVKNEGFPYEEQGVLEMEQKLGDNGDEKVSKLISKFNNLLGEWNIKLGDVINKDMEEKNWYTDTWKGFFSYYCYRIGGYTCEQLYSWKRMEYLKENFQEKFCNDLCAKMTEIKVAMEVLKQQNSNDVDNEEYNFLEDNEEYNFLLYLYKALHNFLKPIKGWV